MAPVDALTPILLIAAWMTYRSLGFGMMSKVEKFGGDVFPTAWVIPLGQDALVGITAPIVVYLLATHPSIASYVIAVAWAWWGITDFCVGMTVEIVQPARKSPFGPHTPMAMLPVWLICNLLIEIYMLYLLCTPEVFEYFTNSSFEDGLSIGDSPMGGAWMWMLIGAGAMGAFFPIVGSTIDNTFKKLGFNSQAA